MTDFRSEVVVVGAGVTGLSIALHLAEAGLRPLVVERSGVGAGASGVQPGGVRQQWSTRLNCELARESAGFYDDLAARLDSTLPLQLSRCGYLFVAHGEERLTDLAAAVAVQNAAGVPSRLVTPPEAADLVPGLDASSLTGASWCDEDGYLDHPQSAVEAFAHAAWARGAELVIGDVASLAPDGAGWRLSLRDGTTLTAGHVVLAAGHETAPLAGALGLELPIARQTRHLFFSEPIAERLLEPLVISSERHFAAKHLANGRVLASDLSATGDPSDDRALWLGHVRAVAADLLPQLVYASFAILVSGVYDVTPDNQPILGPVDGLPGLHLAAGFSGHGFMLAPAVGRRLAGSVLGDAPDEAMRQLSHERFTRGTLERELATV